MKILVIGDTHIPRRASWIPREISSLIENEKFDRIVCTGDLTDEKVLDYLKSLSEVTVVKGNMDHLTLPEYEIFNAGKIKIGVIHGDQVYPRGNRDQLKAIAKKLEVDLLISGHTHSPDIHFTEVLLLNPGSATGVWGGGGGSLKPSFMILEIEDGEVAVNFYELDKELFSTTEKFHLKTIKN